MSLLALKVSDVDMFNKTLRLSDEAKVSSLILPLDFETIQHIETWLHLRQFEVKDNTEQALFLNSRGRALISKLACKNCARCWDTGWHS